MKAPWFPFYTGDFLASTDVQLMEAHEVGAYVLLLTHSWQSDRPGYLPNDEGRLRRLARLSAEQWKDSRELVLSKWPVADDPAERFNPRLVKEAGKQVELREKKAEAGRLSAERRAQQATERQQNANTIPTGVDQNATGVGVLGNYSQPQSQPQTTNVVAEATTAEPLKVKTRAQVAADRAAAEGADIQLPADSPLTKPAAFAAIVLSLFPEADLHWYAKEMLAKAPEAGMTAPSWRNWIINFLKNDAASRTGLVKPVATAQPMGKSPNEIRFDLNPAAVARRRREAEEQQAALIAANLERINRNEGTNFQPTGFAADAFHG